MEFFVLKGRGFSCATKWHKMMPGFSFFVLKGRGFSCAAR
jgi:hypothetical protein